MDLGVRGKSYILVGGSRGIGWEAARVLAEDGAHVAILSRDPGAAKEKAEALAARCRVTVLTLAADVTETGSVEAAIASAVASLGAVRGLAVTNATNSRSRDFLEMDDAEWQHFFQDVMMGSVRCCQAVVPHLLGHGGGQIVLTGAFSARSPKPYVFAYAAFKAALLNVTKNLAKTYGPAGIRVNCVCPGAIATERSNARLEALAADFPDRREAERHLLGQYKMNVALERLGRPEEVGEMIAILLSERAAYATGLIANLDGGTDF